MAGERGKLTDINAVIVPVGPGHILVDIGVDSRHVGRLDDDATICATSCARGWG